MGTVWIKELRVWGCGGHQEPGSSRRQRVHVTEGGQETRKNQRRETKLNTNEKVALGPGGSSEPLHRGLAATPSCLLS